MAWIPFYANKTDEIELLSLLNSDEKIAFIVSDGNHKWKAVKTISQFPKNRICLWINQSGSLPLINDSNKDEWIDNPYEGWTEKKVGNDSDTPYFGAGWPGIIYLNLRTADKNVIGMSSFEWIGNHYSIIGISASENAKKLWSRLKRQIIKRTIKLPRTDSEGAILEIFTFENALNEINKGKVRKANPQ
ncbi:hypothetical protein GYB57_04270 [bacterium]|nr:hypothetical protein [bacterium]